MVFTLILESLQHRTIYWMKQESFLAALLKTGSCLSIHKCYSLRVRIRFKVLLRYISAELNAIKVQVGGFLII